MQNSGKGLVKPTSGVMQDPGARRALHPHGKVQGDGSGAAGKGDPQFWAGRMGLMTLVWFLALLAESR